MIQLELYLKEISNFLRTLTVKNTFYADHMLELWVKDEYKEIVQNDYRLHPYYRNITGDYILFDYSDLEKAYGIYQNKFDSQEEYLKKKAEIIDLAENTYGLTTVSRIAYSNNTSGTTEYYTVPNSKIYNYCNELPIINSFDTQNKIPFTKSILTSAYEINTAEIYKIPNKRYFKLIEKYPTSADIIKAIVYPIEETTIDGVTISPIDRAYNADNMELLAWNSKLLETNEFQSMYECVINTLDMFKRRYCVNEYCFEDLYPQAFGTLMWDILYMELFAQRISNIRTGSVHSYHLWSYLKSHGLGEYRDILTNRQQNFLYKNLRYLIEHKGTQHALEILIYVLLTEQNISLEGKNTIQREYPMLASDANSSLIETAKKTPSIQSITVAKPMLTEISKMYTNNPDLRFQNVLEYMGEHAGENNENDQQEYESGYSETTETIYEKERSAGLEYSDDYLFDKSSDNCDRLISTSPESYRNTKLLELTNNTSSDLYVTLYTKFFAETLMYRLSLGDMNFSISFVPPNNSVPIVLAAKDAVGFIYYALNKANYNTLPDKYLHEYADTGQATDKFTGEPERIWTHGQRVYKTWKQYDKPPRKFQIEWPYRTVFDDVVQDFPSLPTTFNWKQNTYLTEGYLNSIVMSYSVIINNIDYTFNLVSSAVEQTNRKWVCSELSYTIEYYGLRSRWVIVNRNNKVIYQSNVLSRFTLKLEKLTWYDSNDKEVNLNVTSLDKKYVIDNEMKNYNGSFHNVTDFSGKVHTQCMSFIKLYLEVNRSESAVLNALYKSIVDERFANGIVTVDLFDGKTFTEYLDSEDENIILLRDVFQEYDNSSQPELLYNKFAEAIVAALMPIDDALLSSSASTMNDKYQKIIKLFKSMIPYNLAFIESGYRDTHSTVMPNFNTDAYFKKYTFETTEVSTYYDDCRTELWEMYSPTFIGQTNVIRWSTDDLPLTKQCKVLNNLDSIVEILDSTYSTKSKKAKLKQLLNDNDLVTYLMNKSVSELSNLQLITKKIVSEDILDTTLSNNVSIDSSYQRSIVTWSTDGLGDNAVAKQCKILNNINKVNDILVSEVSEEEKKTLLTELLNDESLATYVLSNSDRMLNLATINTIIETYNSPFIYFDKDVKYFGGREPTTQEIEEFDQIIKGQ